MTGLGVTRKGSRRGDPQDKPFVNRNVSATAQCVEASCTVGRSGTTGEDLGRRHSGDTAVLEELCGDEGQGCWFQDHTGTFDEFASDGIVEEDSGAKDEFFTVRRVKG